jgi:hypothetical protein
MFDINEVLAQMVGVIKNIVKDDWKNVSEELTGILQRRKERLALLADLYIKKEITEKRFLSRLEDEKLIFEAEIHAIAVMNKAVAQKAANAAIKVLSDVAKAAIRI